MIDILNRAMVIAERVSNMQEMNLFLNVLFGVLFVFGLLNCILGYRLLRFWVMLFGFAMGAGAGLFTVYRMGVEDKMTMGGVALLAGIILAIVSFLIFKAGVFVLGAGVGMFLTLYVLHPTSSFSFFICLLLSVAVGVVALRFEREVIIIGTSLMGGVLAGVSLGKLLEMPQLPYGVLFSIAFALVGILIQFLLNRKREADDEEEDDIRPDASGDEDDYPMDAEQEEELLEEYFDDYYGEKRKKPKTQEPEEEAFEEEDLTSIHKAAWERKKQEHK